MVAQRRCRYYIHSLRALARRRSCVSVRMHLHGQPVALPAKLDVTAARVGKFTAIHRSSPTLSTGARKLGMWSWLECGRGRWGSQQ